MTRRLRSKLGFTLLEVNLAIALMSTGVLVMCQLYSNGFREARGSVEDVAGIGYADAYLAPLMSGLSATNMVWSKWVEIGDEPTYSDADAGVLDAVWPAGGWSDYIQRDSNANDLSYTVYQNCNTIADQVFAKVQTLLPADRRGSLPSFSKGYYGLVVTRHGAVVQLAFRSALRREKLLANPAFVQEIHFQGDAEQ